MKRTVLIVMAVLGFVLISACRSGPQTGGGGSIEDTLRNIYNRYRGNLILEGAEQYTVVSGDTLSAIARAHYPSGFYYPVIMLASSDVVVDSDRITPGMVLTIPDLQRNLDSPRARANIRDFLLEVARVEDDRGRPLDARGLRDLAATL